MSNSAEARYLSMSKEKEGQLKCELCPHLCLIPPGGQGRCGVRANDDSRAILPCYGQVSALAMDPIEKKPLSHFRPGTQILSLGFLGCNLRCPFCQNWRISQNHNPQGGISRYYSPRDLVQAAKAGDSQIAYTYSEPLVHIEFLIETMTLARREGVANVLVTNGCINQEPAEEVLGLCDAANIDLKCFSPETYRDILGGDLPTVLAFIRLALERAVHVELSTLVVPGMNDSKEELNQCRDFISALEAEGHTLPWHLNAYHRAYKHRAPPTDGAFLLALAQDARKHIKHVYTGNI